MTSPFLSKASNMIFLIWGVMLFFIFSDIGGTLKADLTTTKGESINTFQDILERPTLKPLIRQSSASYFYLMFSNHDELSKVFKQMESTGAITPREEEVCHTKTLREVLKGNAVMIENEHYFMTCLERYCDDSIRGKLYLSRNIPLYSVQYSIFMIQELDSQFLETVNKKVMYFAATKQLTPTLRSISSSSEKCLEIQKEDAAINVFYIYLVWLCGITLATFTLILEIAAFRIMKLFQDFNS